ncbi:DNA polymerase IV [bacterium]|nr:DNA polymerase IV [bacterium]
MQRAIMHVDMDAFYASIEQRDNSKYRNKPVIVGADPKNGLGRGVVSAASYEARKFGIHSALPISRAFKLCPHGIFLPVRGSHYMSISRNIMKIFKYYTPILEPISLDEAFLDLTGSIRLFGDICDIGVQIKHRILSEQGLVASVGIGPNKMIAKIASDHDKPDGFVLVKPEERLDFLAPLPVRRLSGIGKKSEARLLSLGITTISHIQQLDMTSLERIFGSFGQSLYSMCRGEDNSPVLNFRTAKSISNEITFSNDTISRQLVHDTVISLSDKVAYRLRQSGLTGKTVILKIRFQDFSTKIRHSTLTENTQLAEIIRDECLRLIEQEFTGLPVRLVGVGITQLQLSTGIQENLFQKQHKSGSKIARAVDAVRIKYGYEKIHQGSNSQELKSFNPFNHNQEPKSDK